MEDVTTIQVPKKLLGVLKGSKEYPRQSYAELILHMARLFKEARKHSQYDDFLHKIQQPKMRELWDNKHDEAWEGA
ncbi:TPA: hypothetical protein HA244_00955 [Candidatus Micrarchaeota archaeon]|nr:hypothetical protein [Candidatus Micrarchaeota archaeon]